MEAGYTEADFWEMTPAQYSRAIAGYGRRLRVHHRSDVILAHQTAYFQRVKKFPDLGRLLEKMDRAADGAPRKMTADEMKASLRAWRASQKKG